MSSIDRKLRHAAGYGKEAELKELLRNPGCNALNADELGMTALMWATRYGYESCVRLLLPVSDASATDTDGWTTLMWAANYGHEDCLRILLPVSDVQARDNKGRTASASARLRGNRSMTKLIDAYALAQNEQGSIGAAAGPGTASGRLAPRI